MRNIFLGSIFILVFLPQISFGANQDLSVSPQLAAFNQQQDAASRAFFQQQAEERGNFIKAHKDIIDKVDRQAREQLRKKRGEPSLESSQPLSPTDSNTWASFVAKQQSDKQDFLAKLGQERASFLSSQ